MVVLIIESAPPSLRGELSKWMLEPKADKTTEPSGNWSNPDDWSTFLHPEIWGKSPDVELSPGEAVYHPLICHMIDVAMVALRLWQYVLPPVLKEKIQSGLGVETVEEAGLWLAFFAGIHDLGKATPPFARRWPYGWEVLKRKGYGPARSDSNMEHYVMSTYLLRNLLSQMGLPEGIVWPVASVAGGHHGNFPSPSALKSAERFAGEGPWTEAQVNLVRLLAYVLKVDQFPGLTGDLTHSNGLLMILAGLTSVADWIASDHRLFPYAGNDVRLPSYPRRSRWLAWKALHRLGWLHRPRSMSPLAFQELFDKVPNHLQEQIIEIAPGLCGPSLILLEYPMGGGKTEGAIYLSDYLAATAGQGGVYFALPTMATSNQMFGRVSNYLISRFPGSGTNVQLLHGHAALNAEFKVLKQAGSELIQSVRANGDKESGLLAAEWFTYKKRGLLAPYGIGTIDQALLAVLQTKHFFVRLFGLAGKVVILDEIHAYDSYMQTLLCRLIAWLGACNTSVVLLSATLPSQTRQALLSAYAHGRGLPVKESSAAYPRISWVTEGTGGARHITGVLKRDVALRFLRQSDELWIEKLKIALSGGGCAAVILNTVTRAQTVYQQLKSHFPREELVLFHARYPFNERMARERAILDRFGPGDADRPRRAVVVATQVIEQSLDLDFDLVVTDLAPIDLLLQRSGRVWRHQRPSRPSGLTAPALWVLMPQLDDEGRPIFEKGSVRVYDLHTLLRTWLVLDGKDLLKIPDDVEVLVESVYSMEPAKPELSEPIRCLWNWTRAKSGEEKQRDEKEAQRRYIPDVFGDLFTMPLESLDEENETLHQAHQALTRLGGPSVSVICLLEEEGRLWAAGEEFREIHLEKRPDSADLRALLGRSLRISFAPGLVKRILAQEVPQAWRGSAYLRRCRLLRFSPDGACCVADLPLSLDPELGLVFDKKREEEDL